MTDVMVVMTTVPRDMCHALAEHILSKRLAACINEVPVTSHYWWQGEIVHDREQLLVMKTCREKVPALIDGIRTVHPYEIPEIIAVPVAEGFAGYLSWVGRETGCACPMPDGNCF